MLVAARRSVVSVDRIVDQLWQGQPPARSITSLQTYVSNLRRLLEPDRAPRTASTTLITVPPGYAFRLADEDVDAWQFERMVRDARRAEPADAVDLLGKALALWQGAAFADFADQPWAATEVARLNELRLSARELYADVTRRSGHAAEAIPLAEELTQDNPLREEGWRQVALALWLTGRQGEALESLRRHRRILRDELGLDPTRAIADLEAAILRQRDEQRPAAVPVATSTRELFVGRADELERAHKAALTARTTGRVLLISGEEGIGKTRLLDRIRQELAADGWTVLSGRCPEYEGAPPAWAWSEALRQLAARRNPPAPPAVMPLLLDDPAVASGENPDAGRFYLHRAVSAWLASAAGQAPLAIALDDVHAADAETLTLIERVAERLAGRPSLIIATFRPAEGGDRLTAMTARAARLGAEHIALGGLTMAEVADLVAAVAGEAADDRTVAALAQRTGGNPFYVGESARLLLTEGASAAVTAVPHGVRDVLRRRLRATSDGTRAVLQAASVLGGDIDTETLAAAVDDDLAGQIEPALATGLLVLAAPGRVRFRHSLVRDVIYGDLPLLCRSQLHARVAAVLERVRPEDHAALAHHYTRAASAEAAPPAVRHALLAAAAAERLFAADTAAELLVQAVEAAERIPREDGHDDRMVELLALLTRAQIRTGALMTARDTRRRAMEIAERAGRDDLLATALAAWSEPSSWQSRAYGSIDRRTVNALERLLAGPDLDPQVRCRLLDTLVSELDGPDDPRARQAAQAELALAREVGDPLLIAAGLMALAKCLSYELEVDHRGRIADELRDVARTTGVPAQQWFAEHLAGTVCAARADREGLRRHAELGLDIARQFGMAEQTAVSLATTAMLAHISGDYDRAEKIYADVYDRLLNQGSIHAWYYHASVQANLYLSRGMYAEAEPIITALNNALGPIDIDRLAVILIRLGRADEARALPAGYPLRKDYMHSFHASMRAEAAVLSGDRDTAAALVPRLRPLRDHLAGVTSTTLASSPIACTLGRLHRLLGEHEQARQEFEHGLTIARLWGSPHWIAEATEELDVYTRSARGEKSLP
jgi:DNA-binding SARP family transcriptional activator